MFLNECCVNELFISTYRGDVGVCHVGPSSFYSQPRYGLLAGLFVFLNYLKATSFSEKQILHTVPSYF